MYRSRQMTKQVATPRDMLNSIPANNRIEPQGDDVVCVKSFARIAAVCLLLLGCGLATTPTWAVIGSITPSPSSANAPLAGTVSVPVTWRVLTLDGPFVNSPNGTFRTAVGGVVLGTVPIALNKPAAATTTATFTEVVLIPTDVIYRAHKMGLTSFLYSRDFGDGTGMSGVPQNVTINIATSAASGFSLSGMSLVFDNGAVVRLLGQKEKLYAQVDLNFTGSGLLQGVWEVADPASTSGEPIYRPLKWVRQYLVGSDRQTLCSPDLPTDSAGLYLVRLRVTEPVPGFEQPILRYFVSSGKPGEILPVMPIGLVSPPHQTLLAPDTVFAWEAIRGAHAYQVELYARAMTSADKLPSLGVDANTTPPPLPNTPPVSGMLVAGKQTQTVLSATARSHLHPGSIYLWRVLAIGEDGRIVGLSPVRELHLP